MKQIKGAVTVVGAEGEELHILPPRTYAEHNPDFWAQVMDWDLITGRRVTSTELLSRYDVILINGNIEAFDLLKSIREMTSAKLLILIEGSQSALSYYHTKEKIEYINALNMVDGIGTLNKDYDFFRLFSEKPIQWLGVPYDLEFVKRYQSSAMDKDHGLWGIGSNLHSHNSIVSLYVAKQAQVSCAKMQSFPQDKADDFCESQHLDFVELHKPYPWHKFLEVYTKCWGAIVLSNEYTWGRYPLDFAALGMPVVGSARQYTQKILFPSLCFEPYTEIDQAIAATKRLMTDMYFYNETIKYARSCLHLFDIKASQLRMEKLLEEVL